MGALPWMAFCDAVSRGMSSLIDAGGLLQKNPLPPVLFTTRAAEPLTDFVFRPDDVLLFGKESAGSPDYVHAAADARIYIPIRPEARSLNLSVSAGIALWEGLRQLGELPSR